jgi:hypothetical protein
MVADPVKLWCGCVGGAQQHLHPLHTARHWAHAAGVGHGGGLPHSHNTWRSVDVPGQCQAVC